MAVNPESTWEQVALPGGATNFSVGPTLASAATIAPTYAIHHVSGTAAISTITPPWTGFTGTITLIPDGAWTLATGGNIKAAYQAVANQPLELQFDGTSWFPVSGSSGAVIQYFDPTPQGGSAATSAVAAGTMAVVPFVLAAPAQFASVDFMVSGAQSATNAGSSFAETLTAFLGIYTKNSATLSAVTNLTATTAYTITGSSSSVSYQGVKAFPVAVALNLTAGNYWYAAMISTATAGNAVAAGLSAFIVSVPGQYSTSVRGILGSSSAGSNQLYLGGGLVSAAQTTAPASIAFSDIQGTAIGVTSRPWIVFRNYTV